MSKTKGESQAAFANKLLVAFDMCSENLGFNYSVIELFLLILGSNPIFCDFNGQLTFLFSDCSKLVVKYRNKKLWIKVVTDDPASASEPQKPVDDAVH